MPRHRKKKAVGKAEWLRRRKQSAHATGHVEGGQYFSPTRGGSVVTDADTIFGSPKRAWFQSKTTSAPDEPQGA